MKRRFIAKRRPVIERRAGIVRDYILGVEKDGGEFYLVLGGENVINRIVTKKDEYKGVLYKVVRACVREIDGINLTLFKVNEKYVKALMAQETIHSAYGMLSQYFTDDDMRLLFYDLWLKEHNFIASEQNRKEYNRCCGHFRRPTSDQRHVKHITTAMGIKEAAKAGI